MVRIVLCDSNRDYCDILDILISSICKKHDIPYHISKIYDEHDFRKSINLLSYDVIFIGIRFDTTNGVELIREIKDKNKIIVFLTYLNIYELARDIYSLNAYKVILKEDIRDIENTILSIIKKLNNTETYSIELDGHTIIKKDINYITTNDNLLISTKEKVLSLDLSITYNELRYLLFENFFYSDYKNYFINIDNITDIQDNTIFFGDNHINIPFADTEKVKFYYYSTHE